MIWHVQKENFIFDSTRIFMKVFHLLLFDGSLIIPECILIFCLILLLMIDSTSDQKDIEVGEFVGEGDGRGRAVGGGEERGVEE
ncbi:hypothetical protein DCAR_0830922 [Daucus carota subsp. sativus]|uniref:NAD(P)H-quinone oxidoreductase subunit 2 N-terminal domain-containing protein n=1 Tax=Daucus carota subsp. sativus TaxID=79200 RepID=A0AAF1BCQ3_DAUCS|nr:hypothetical protein DCAR_0830922 [Daucus carota subsp. sativus]